MAMSCWTSSSKYLPFHWVSHQPSHSGAVDTQLPELGAGYNNSAVKSALTQPDALVSLVNRPSLGVHPSLDYVDRMKRSLLSVAPPGLSKVSTMMCGTCSNENAFKAAFIKYMVWCCWFVPATTVAFLQNKKRNGPADLSSPEYKDTLLNKVRWTIPRMDRGC